MIVNTITNPTRTSSKLSSSAMTVNITGTSFSFILDNLYTYPHRAIVRELSCNAWDAHVAAGNTAPFHIQVPSKLNPTLIIKDFGVGLDAEEIDKYLNTLYSSSKGETNDQIGGFGLGSKSPFALVPSFYIISVKDGKEYKCFWYRDSEGIPVLTIQSTKDTDQPNGLTYVVQFPEKEVDGIITACASELSCLPTPPLFFSDINDPSTMFDHIGNNGIEVLQRSENYSIIKDTQNLLLGAGHYYRSDFIGIDIGGVSYTIPRGFNTYDFLNKTVKDFSSLFNHSNQKIFMVKIPIGLIKLPSTREHILDTTENLEIIKKYAEIACNSYSHGLVERYKNHSEELLPADQKNSLSAHLPILMSYIKQNSLLQDPFINTLTREECLVLDGAFKDVFEQITSKLYEETPYTITGFLSGQVLYNSSSTDLSSSSIRYNQNRINLATCKKIKQQVFRTSSSPYDQSVYLTVLNQPSSLIIINDENKMMTSWIRGVTDISTYSSIWRVDFNPIYDSLKVRDVVKKVIEASLESNSLVMFASELKQPEEAKIVLEDGTEVVDKPLAIVPGVRLIPSLDVHQAYNDASKISYMYDEAGKKVPLGEEYLKAEEDTVILFTRNQIRTCGYKYNLYLESFKTPPASCMYITTDTQFEVMKKIVERSGKKLITFDGITPLPFEHLNLPLLKQAVILSTILSDLPHNGARILYLQKYSKDYDLLDLKEYMEQLSKERYFYSNYNFVPDAGMRNLLFYFTTELKQLFKDDLKNVNIIEEASQEELANLIRDQLHQNTFLLEVFNQLIKKETV